jgi:PhoH-like ATPase
MNKIYILDTNVLLHDPRSLNAFEDNEVVIPLVVLDELDKKKQGLDETAKHARMVIRSLDKLRSNYSLHKGASTPGGGLLRVELHNTNKCPPDLDQSRADNRLISVALGLIEEEAKGTRRQVKLITKDINLRVKCDALGVPTADYIADSVAENPNSIYEGTAEIEVSSDVIDSLHNDGFVDASNMGDFFANQYVNLRSNISSKHSGLAKYKSGALVKINTFNNVWGISSRNREQAFALDALFDSEIKLVTLIGKAGSGKTLVSAAAGVAQLLDSKTYKKLIMTRPVQPLGRDIGFLPGSKEEKLAPWMAPLQDNLDLLFSAKGSNYLDMQRDAGVIEVEALTYIRGRSIPKSYIIVDEAQNLSKHEIKTIITRVGEGSKVVLTGDIMQIDNPFIDSLDNGLSCVIENFKHLPIAAHVTLQKGERSELATIAAEIL